MRSNVVWKGSGKPNRVSSEGFKANGGFAGIRRETSLFARMMMLAPFVSEEERSFSPSQPAAFKRRHAVPIGVAHWGEKCIGLFQSLYTLVAANSPVKRFRPPRS
jgi:hypothetical protein